jgi:hypothetical protein
MQAGYTAATSPANFRILFAVLVAAVGTYLAFGEHVAAWWKKTQADIAAKKTASSTPQAADANADLVAGFEHLLALKVIHERQQLRSPEEIEAAFIAGIGSIYKPSASPTKTKSAEPTPPLSSM